MSMKNTFACLLLAGAILPACVVRTHGSAHISAPAPVAVIEVEEEPPPARVVVVQPRAGFVWVEGRYIRSGGRWVWRDGYYERQRSGHVWVQGRWERRGRRHVWVEGHWQAGGHHHGPVIRDHRRR